MVVSTTSMAEWSNDKINDLMVNGKYENGKLIRDGQLIIIRNGAEYNANGQRVR